MQMIKILESSGWECKEAAEGLEYHIPLSEEKFYYEEDQQARLYIKKRYKNSKLWAAKRLEMEGSWVEIGDYLTSNGLINEGEFTQAKNKYLEEERRKQLQKEKELKQQKMGKVEKVVTRLGKNLINVSKKIVALSMLAVISYTSYQYVENKVDPTALYVYLKENIGSYDLKELVVNDTVDTLTYTQLRNLDYAIENNQVAELLEEVENKPENIHYISVLKENLKEKQN